MHEVPEQRTSWMQRRTTRRSQKSKQVSKQIGFMNLIASRLVMIRPMLWKRR